MNILFIEKVIYGIIINMNFKTNYYNLTKPLNNRSKFNGYYFNYSPRVEKEHILKKSKPTT